MTRVISDVLNFTVQEGGVRLDKFLAESYGELSRSFLKKLIEEGYVYVNEEQVKKPSKKLKEGDNVTLLIPEPEELRVEPENIPLEIIYEDDYVAVVVKPCGLVVHPSPGYTSGTLVNALLYHLKNLSSIGGVERPGIVHRLDKETAGLMVVAKNDYAHRELVRQFQERRTVKFYKVLVSGLVPRDYDIIEMPIGRHPKERKKFSVREEGKEAKTEFWVLRRFERLRVTLLRVRIHTGRTHQIRVHFSHLGFPVLGDKTYGFKSSSLPKELISLMGKCNMLIAYKLGFFHPKSGKFMEFEIDDPEPFRSVRDWLESTEGARKGKHS